jgi:hypothetical protein
MSRFARRASRAVLAGATLRALVTTTTLAATAALASPATAQTSLGTLVVTGVADATELGSPGVLLDFTQHVRIDPAANTGIFAHLNNGGAGAAGSMGSITVGSGPQPVSSVLHIGGFRFDLAFLPSGAFGQDDCYVAPAVGQQCTPYQLPGDELSPFYLENVAAGGSDAMFSAIVSFDMTGTVTGHGQRHAFTGTITAFFEGLSYQEALMGLEQHGLRGVPFTGTFVVGADGAHAATVASASASVVPEPSTAALVAAGLAAMAGVARRRKRQ